MQLPTALLLLLPLANAERITVGGESAGWIVQPYAPIAARVGDTLVFSYAGQSSGGYHDVMLVDNEVCDFSGGTMLDESGLTALSLSPNSRPVAQRRPVGAGFEYGLTSVGTFTFACTKSNHCAQGQQVTVTVAPATGVRHVVGGATGWTHHGSYSSMASPLTLSVGDTLVFDYNGWGPYAGGVSGGYHDVVLADSESCDFSGCSFGLDALQRDVTDCSAAPGTTVLDMSGTLDYTLTQPGTFIFTTTKQAYCSGGQRLVVTVGDGSAPVASQCSRTSDVDGDLDVDVGDLLALLGAFGGVLNAGTAFELWVDVNGLLGLLGDFGRGC